MSGAHTRSILGFAALASTLTGCAIYFAGPSNEGVMRRRVPRHEKVGVAGQNVTSAGGEQQLAKDLEQLDHMPGVMRRVNHRVNSQRSLGSPIHYLMMVCFVAALTRLAHEVWGKMTTEQHHPSARTATQPKRSITTFLTLSFVLAGCAMYLVGPSHESVMRRVPRHQIVDARLEDSHIVSADGHAQPSNAPDLLQHMPAVIRRVKHRTAGALTNSELLPSNLLFMLSVVATLTVFAHLVYGSPVTRSANDLNAVDAASTQGKENVHPRALTSNPWLLLALVTLALTVVGCALYLAGTEDAHSGYVRRVLHHESVGHSTISGQVQPAKAPELLEHMPGVMRRVKPRAVADTQLAFGRPIHCLLMLCVVATFTGFAHRVWGSTPTSQKANVSKAVEPVTALTKDPRVLLTLVALALTLAWGALYLSDDEGVAGGYMRRVPHGGSVGDAASKALVLPKATTMQTPLDFLFVLCVFAALHAFAYQVWGRIMALQHSSTDPKASKA